MLWVLYMKKASLYTLVALFLSSCSSSGRDDPYFKTNKAVTELNLSIDREVLQPAAHAYNKGVPSGVRSSLGNFLGNLEEPYYFVSYIVLFDATRASTALFRFAINSTVGILGLFDVAKHVGLKRESIEYKDTMHRMGISPGDYIVLPAAGPSSSNYIVGGAISLFANPLSYVIGFPYMIAAAIMRTVNDRADNYEAISSITGSNIDQYSVIKNIYDQKYNTKYDAKKNDDDVSDLSDSPTPDDYDELEK